VKLPGPPSGKPPGADITAMEEVDEAKRLDQMLQEAIKAKDLDRLNDLLTKATLNTKTVRYARNLKSKLEEVRGISDKIRQAIDDVDIPNLKQLLNQGYQLGLTESDLIKAGRHLCYGLSVTDQFTMMVKKAMQDNNLEKLKDLLDEATSEFIDNEEIENARTFLAIHSDTHDWNSQMRVSRAQVASDAQSSQKEAYHKFLLLKGQCPLSKCPILRREDNYAKRNYFKKKQVKTKRLQWQRDDIPRSLLRLSTAYCGNNRALSKHVKNIAKQLFKNIRGYMNDHYHPYPVTLAYEVVNVGVNEPLLRDEIFCQLIKQTTLNPKQESVILGLKLFYLCISTFAPSKDLTPFVFSHLALFAHPELPEGPVGFNTIEDLATNCWIAHELLVATVSAGESGDPPSMQDIEQMTQGKLAPMLPMEAADYGPPSGPPPGEFGGPPQGDFAGGFPPGAGPPGMSPPNFPK